MVMQRIANPSTPVRFRPQPQCNIIMYVCPGGGIGRHKGLKIPRRKLRAGSSPAPGTRYLYKTKTYRDIEIFAHIFAHNAFADKVVGAALTPAGALQPHL